MKLSCFSFFMPRTDLKNSSASIEAMSCCIAPGNDEITKVLLKYRPNKG